MPAGAESHKIAKKARKTIAKKVGKTPSKFEKYWKSGKEQAGIEEEGVDEQAAGGKKPREPYAYAMAVALRRAQRTGAKPHKKLTREWCREFEEKLGQALNQTLSNLDEAGLKCPKCGSRDALAGTKTLKNHCASCGNEWGEGDKPKKMKEDATTTAGIPDTLGGGPVPVAKKKKEKKEKKPGNGGGRYIKKDWDLTTHESIDKIADIISEDISTNNGFEFDDDIDEAYNDNYLRPNQAERRTNQRQADGTQPPGALEDDVITEYPGSPGEDVDIWVIKVYDATEELRAIAEQHNVAPEHGIQPYKDHIDYIFYKWEDAKDFQEAAKIAFPDLDILSPEYDQWSE